MKHRTVRGITALTLGAALLLSACGSDDAETPSASASATSTDAPVATEADIAALDAVEVAGDAGAEPTLTIAAPFTTGAEVVRVVSEGTGDEILADNLVGLQLVVYKGSDGTQLQSTWAEPAYEATLTGADLPAALNEALIGQKAGVRLLFAQPQASATGAGDTIVYAIDALTTRPKPPALTLENGMPTATFDESGAPTVTVSPDFSGPTELVTEVLKDSDGAVVEAGQSVTVNYSGFLLSTGEKFDSSWDRGETFDVSPVGTAGVIDGWNQGLVGQKVGSTIMLVIPPELGYGAQGNGSIPGGATLVFVIEIVAAS